MQLGNEAPSLKELPLSNFRGFYMSQIKLAFRRFFGAPESPVTEINAPAFESSSQEALANVHLCKNCHETLTLQRPLLYADSEDGPEEGTSMGHHRTLHEFQVAVETERCWICLQLRTQLSHELYQALIEHGEEWIASVGYLTWVNSSTHRHKVHWRIGNKLKLINPGLDFDIAPTQFIGEKEPTTPGGCGTDSLEAWNTAQQWLTSCSDTHITCKERPSTRILPSRLLDLSDRRLDVDEIRLVDTGELSQNADYCTLSHCWGSEPFLTLKDSNIQRMKNSIELSSLAKTFQHAVEITRRMDVRYLWIDSLCIIQHQDDLTDWRYESARMAQYYSNSYCNISATASENSSQGLFRTRDQASIRYEMARRGDSVARTYSLVLISKLDNQIMNAPLHRRAWVLQERFLARRILHFCEGQLWWECNTLTACEVAPRGMQVLTFPRNFPTFKRPAEDQPAHPTTDPTQFREAFEDKWNWWHHLAIVYSRCFLAFSRDKTVALEGVTKYFEDKFSDDCVFGLWKGHLPRQLLWRAEPGSVIRAEDMLYEQPRTYDIPSWSWMSSDRPLQMYGTWYCGTESDRERMMLEVVSIRGQKYLGGRAYEPCVSPPEKHPKSDDKTLVIIVRCIHAELFVHDGGIFLDLGRHSRMPICYTHFDGLVPDLEAHGDWMSVFITPAREYDDGTYHNLDCLILRPVEHSPGTYVRIGLVMLDVEPDDPKPDGIDLILEACGDDPRISSMHYDPGTRYHTIALI